MLTSYVFTKTSLVTFSHALCRFHEYCVELRLEHSQTNVGVAFHEQSIIHLKSTVDFKGVST